MTEEIKDLEGVPEHIEDASPDPASILPPRRVKGAHGRPKASFQKLLEGIVVALKFVEARYISPEVILYLYEELGFTSKALATLFQCKVHVIDYKVKTARERGIMVKDEYGHFAFRDFGDAEFCDMPTEEKIVYITRKYDRCIDNKEEMTKDQISAMQVRLADLRKVQAEEIQEGKEHINNLLNVIMKDFVRDFKAAFDASFSRLKADMVRVAVEAIWDEAFDRIREGVDDSDKIRDAVVHNLRVVVDGLGTDFDVVGIYVETNKKHSAIKEQIDKYLEKAGKASHGRVGGGTIRDESSAVGGMSYKQRDIEAKREEMKKVQKINL